MKNKGEKELPMDKNKLKKLVDYAVREGTEHTTDGRWSVSYDELYYRFGEAVTDTNENGKLLKKKIAAERRNQCADHDGGCHRDDLSSGALS